MTRPERGRALHDVTQAGTRALITRALRGAPWGAVAFAVVLFAAFVELSGELTDTEPPSNGYVAFDRGVLQWAARLRRPWLNAVAVDLTALGSPLLVALFTVVVGGLLLAGKDRPGAGVVFTSSLASALLTLLLKGLLERPRPDVIPRLVHVTSLAYPSGHSLASSAVYLTAAFVVARHLATGTQRLLAVAFAALIVLSVGASRVYLGVHHPSDVVGGILVGTGWASLMGALLRWSRPRGRRESEPALQAESGRAR